MKEGYVQYVVVSFPDHIARGWPGNEARVSLVPDSCPAFCHLKYGFVRDGQVGWRTGNKARGK